MSKTYFTIILESEHPLDKDEVKIFTEQAESALQDVLNESWKFTDVRVEPNPN